MARRREHYVVFGVPDTANKAVIAGKSKRLPGAYAVAITDLQGTHERGETDFPIDDIGGVYTTLYFCKRESLDTFIRVLEYLRDRWDEKSESAGKDCMK